MVSYVCIIYLCSSREDRLLHVTKIKIINIIKGYVGGKNNNYTKRYEPLHPLLHFNILRVWT